MIHLVYPDWSHTTEYFLLVMVLYILALARIYLFLIYYIDALIA